MANCLQEFSQGWPPFRGYREQGIVAAGDREPMGTRGLTLVRAQLDDRTRLRGFAGADMCQRRVSASESFNEDLHPAACGLAPPQPRGNNPGVVEHQQIVGTQEVEQFAKAVVTDVAAGPVQAQQATGAALGQGVLGDQVRWQPVAEIGALHGDEG